MLWYTQIINEIHSFELVVPQLDMKSFYLFPFF